MGLADFAQHYLYTVFALDPAARMYTAVAYSFTGFFAMYLCMVVPVYLWLQSLPVRQRLRPNQVAGKQIQTEILFSLQSMLVFALLTGLVFYLLRLRLLHVDTTVSGWRWLAEIVALLIWNELHFYSTHRLLHTRWLFRRVHIVHHRSITVTPFATWRFHWLEALMLGAVMPLAMLFHSFSVWSLMLLPPGVAAVEHHRTQQLATAWPLSALAGQGQPRPCHASRQSDR